MRTGKTIKNEYQAFFELLNNIGFCDDELYSDLWLIKDDKLHCKTIPDEHYTRMAIMFREDDNNYVELAKKLLASEFFINNEHQLISDFIDFWGNINNFN